MSADALVEIDIQAKLKRVASGKVRDVFEIDSETLLFVASDRISAYDVVMKNGIPEKGALLTAMSAFWFNYLTTALPHLRTHLLSLSLPPALSTLPPELTAQLQPRSMQVRRYQILPIESIVRGYITGSAWNEYKTHGTVHGIPIPAGLREGGKLKEPIWTPSTKAEAGQKDENISPEKAAEIIGVDYANQMAALSLQLYKTAAAHALTAGLILADTKFEFGLDTSTTPASIVLADEVLTPDSSRFWPADTYAANVGGPQPSYDKQYLRDWLTAHGKKGVEGVEVPEDVVRKTAEKYREAFERITGGVWGA
ncbi:phosphoribosylaminoimidazole-succinocarboxamide synthase-like protein [Glonium stellatum]|uniref:Phosphoribosylaminoimidazole-succinocarboxamide synthase n=1 Tax=Glonium stellatum TaxID=574774 RepID=A0A8E2F811_9PEZI|nr:phosphoribosylaminoimidazole-succinocarboxamide synthase-like protein [Glonium stellatum]